MTPFNAFVLFVLIWWTALFAILPLGTRPNPSADAATGWRGVPERARIGRKLLINTLVTLVIWGACYTVISSGLLSFRSGILEAPRD